MFGTFDSGLSKTSIIHRLNPSLKLVCVVFMLVMIFLPTGFFGKIVLIVITTIFWFMSRLGYRKWFSIFKSCFLMFVVMLLINWATYKTPGVTFNVNGDHTLLGFDWNWIVGNGWASSIKVLGHEFICCKGDIWGGTVGNFTTDMPGKDILSMRFNTGLFYDDLKQNHIYIYLPYSVPWYALSSHVLIVVASITLKIYLMIATITILTSTTTSVQLTFAIEDILNPLRILKLPVNEWATTISIAIRFVPSLLEESQKIMRAQASRGVDFHNGYLKDKAKSLVSLVVPMFSIAFKKADELANATEARNYNPRYIRTRYRNFPVRIVDWIGYLFIVILFAIVIMFVAKGIIIAPLFPLDGYII